MWLKVSFSELNRSAHAVALSAENGCGIVFVFEFPFCCFEALFPLLHFFYIISSKNFVNPLNIFKHWIFFSLKTLEIVKCLQRQQNASVLNSSPFSFFREVRWILNRVRLSPRYWLHTWDVAFRYSTLPTLFIFIFFAFKFFFRLNLRSPIHGRGLFCTRNIAAGEMVIEYSGMLVRSVLTDKREKYYESKVGNHIYLTWVTFLTLPSAQLVIINHFTPRSYG